MHNTYPKNADGHREFNKLCDKCFTNNLYIPDHNGDTLIHIVVRFGAEKIFKFLMALFIKSNKGCNQQLGPIDFDKEGTR